MFQNISKKIYTKEKKNIEDFKLNKRFDTTLLPEHIIIYVLSFMISMVGFKNVSVIAPFGISIFCAILSTSTPIGIPFILIFIGELIAFGPPQVCFIYIHRNSLKLPFLLCPGFIHLICPLCILSHRGGYIKLCYLFCNSIFSYVICIL